MICMRWMHRCGGDIRTTTSSWNTFKTVAPERWREFQPLLFLLTLFFCFSYFYFICLVSFYLCLSCQTLLKFLTKFPTAPSLSHPCFCCSRSQSVCSSSYRGDYKMTHNHNFWMTCRISSRRRRHAWGISYVFRKFISFFLFIFFVVVS